ncbi:MAG: VWA domain-containing protein [Dehalococcoidales bacterium]|nr:VWA domain-containing protein [Dehalococcoidales bacterium]
MGINRYSEWDGSQNIFEPDADALIQELQRNLMYDGDLSQALRMMQRGGLTDRMGRRLPSIRELMERLKQRRKEQLEKYNLGSMMEDIRKKLDDIIDTEKQGIHRRVEQAREKAGDGSRNLQPDMQEKLLTNLEERVSDNLKKLDELPQDTGGRIKELSQYDFMDGEARQKFQELMDTLKRNAMSSFAKDMAQRLKNMDADSLAAMRHFIEAVNQMLEARRRGEEPDFEKFLKEFGSFFGDNPPKNLDELLERLQQQMAQGQALMDSLSPEDRQELQELMDSMLDQSTKYEMAKMMANMESLFPGFLDSQGYDFSGDESISYSEAMKLMEHLQKMDTLEEQFFDSRYNDSLDEIDENLVKELLGDNTAEELKRMREITKMLEDAGYIRKNRGQYQLTPRGIKKIGEKALKAVFSTLKKDRSGSHSTRERGTGGERTDETKKYEFGDDLDLHLQKTLTNAILRKPQVPIQMTVDDFEVYRQEQTTRSATVIMLDMSLSMRMGGNFEAAKIVSLALNSLISSKFPKDSLHILGFSAIARRLTVEELTYISWDDFTPYTNMQFGFMMARKMLSKERASNKQIIMISDGQPTAHIENGNIVFQLPTTRRCIDVTLREVHNCTRAGIVINTFMLPSRDIFNMFVDRMARLNHGRVFFTEPGDLGKYIIVDYINNKRTTM